jgi:histidinol-phosphatase (PHP family)
MLTDYHVHTKLCRHAEGEMADYVQAAAAAGLDEIGFADHSPWPIGYDSQYRMTPGEFPQYRAWVREMQDRGGPVRIRYGLETDWVPGCMEEVFGNLAAEPFDYLLGSIHYTDELPFDDPPNAWRWQEQAQVDHVWRRYAELMLEMVCDGRIDILSHFDLPKKFGWQPTCPNAFLESVDEIFRVAGEHGLALEINTSGLRKPVGEIYPSLAVLQRACERGVGLTLGSDAHIPGDVAADFPAALDLARAAGYREIRTYQHRRFTGHRI